MEEVAFGELTSDDQRSSTVVHDWNQDKEEAKEKIKTKKCMLLIQAKPLTVTEDIVEFVKWTDVQDRMGHFYAGRFKDPFGKVHLITNMFKANAIEALSDDKVKVAQAIRKEVIRKDDWTVSVMARMVKNGSGMICQVRS